MKINPGFTASFVDEFLTSCICFRGRYGESGVGGLIPGFSPQPVLQLLLLCRPCWLWHAWDATFRNACRLSFWCPATCFLHSTKLNKQRASNTGWVYGCGLCGALGCRKRDSDTLCCVIILHDLKQCFAAHSHISTSGTLFSNSVSLHRRNRGYQREEYLTYFCTVQPFDWLNNSISWRL